MYKFAIIAVSLLTVLLFSNPAKAGEGDVKGPAVMAEYLHLDLPGDDKVMGVRLHAGYQFKFGLRLSGQLSYWHLDRPSVDGVPQTEACPLPDDRPYKLAPSPYMLEPDFNYWGVGPSIGWDIPFVDGWFGMDVMATFSFPITNDSSGWAFEGGPNLYFSFAGMSDGEVPLYLMGGIKFGHYDQDCDCYEIRENRMMPGAALKYVF